MSLTSSGQIKLTEIRDELGGSGEVSLTEASDGTVATINTANDSGDRPDGNAPHAMSEFYSYDHDLASTSFSPTSFTGVTLGGDAGDTASSSNKTFTLTGGSGGCSGAITTTGGPFGNFKVAVATSGTPSSFRTQTQINGDSVYTGWNSGDRIHRTQWEHTPSNKDGTGTYTWTITNNSVTATISGNISFLSFGGLCIYENIPVNVPNGLINVNKLNIGDLVKSYNFETQQVEEVPILDIKKPIHKNLIKVTLDDSNRGDDWKQEIILTTDHPIYTKDGTMVSDNPELTKSRYNIESTKLKVNDLVMVLGKYYANVINIEEFKGEHNTYTILTKNDNFYADGVLVSSELKSK
jgi:hypothetical protein